MNYSCNRIECNLEFKFNIYTEKLNLDKVVPGCQPYILKRMKKNKSKGKAFYSIAFKFQTVDSMIHLYDYFMINRLYSDYKFYRVSQIKPFLKIRSFKNYSISTPEWK